MPVFVDSDKAGKWASVAGLLAAAALCSHPGPFEVVVRFLMTAGAMVVMFQAFQGAPALFSSPAARAFSSSGELRGRT